MTGTKSILLIGLSNSGKTHYGGQLELRLKLGESKLKKYTASKENVLFKETTKNLINGLASEHTPSEMKKSTDFPLVNENNEQFEMIWQDYAGEQIKDIFSNRSITEQWQQEIKTGKSWLLFIRLDDIKVKKDITMQAPSEMKGNDADDKPYDYSDQTIFIELLQLMLFTKGIRKRIPVNIPLTVILTCWDEMNEKEMTKPAQVLKAKTPMLFSYLKNNWNSANLKILGLSSLGKSLDMEKPDIEFKKTGPENNGYVILPDGSKSKDLTLPLVYALESI